MIGGTEMFAILCVLFVVGIIGFAVYAVIIGLIVTFHPGVRSSEDFDVNAAMCAHRSSRRARENGKLK